MAIRLLTESMVRTPAQIAAMLVAGVASAACACGWPLVELPRPVRLTLPDAGPVVLAFAHCAGDGCLTCRTADAATRTSCSATHGAPCGLPDPVRCAAGDCDLPAELTGGHCLACSR